jgi:transcriptional regulator with PAS, ATPase and Fis domain
VKDYSGVRGWGTLEDVVRDYLQRVLEDDQHDYDRVTAILGIHRKTLLRKLRLFGQN